MMKIEEGKSYRDELGAIWGVLGRDSGVVPFPWRLVNAFGHVRLFSDNGYAPNRAELVSEVHAAPAAVAVKPLEWVEEGFGELLEELRDASKSPHVAQPLADLFGEAFDALMDLNRLVDDLAAAEKKRSARCSAVDTTTLQWREYPNEYYPDVFGHCWDAETPFGRYEIAEASGSDSPYYNVRFGTSFVADKDGLPDAKAAAQADYDARIRSALASPTVSDEMVERERQFARAFDAISPYLRPFVRLSEVRAALLAALGGHHD